MPEEPEGKQEALCCWRAKNLEVEKQVGMFIICVKAALDLLVPLQIHCREVKSDSRISFSDR